MLAACNSSNKENESSTLDGEAITAPAQDTALALIGYHLAEPTTVYSLPESLNEISGMQMIGPELVACVQDEECIIYLFNLETGKLEREIKWGKNGDYEGIAGNESALYIVESGGDLFKVSNYMNADKPQVQKLKTRLEKNCDAEGLYFLADKHVLLIACKEGKKGVRNIWAFDLQKEALQSAPYLQIPQEVLEQELVKGGLDRFSLGLKKALDAKGESGVLAPSGIAQHPVTKDFYILSAQSNLLVVVTPEGEVKYVEELRNSLFQQPESITFTAAGDMLIGNEAKGGKPNILRFKYENK